MPGGRVLLPPGIALYAGQKRGRSAMVERIGREEGRMRQSKGKVC
jgi:hypothetical protein